MTGVPSGSESTWQQRLELQPHPEGGWFRRIYTSSAIIDAPGGHRPLATSIYYLLTREQPIGRLHRNRSDILHFLIDGGPLEYLVVAADGCLQRVELGAAQRFLLVPGDCWKASRLLDGTSHALIAEVVTPGFDFADHRFATLDDLRQQCPQHLTELTPFVESAVGNGSDEGC